MTKLKTIKLIYWISGLCTILLCWANEFLQIDGFSISITDEDFNMSEAIIESAFIMIIVVSGSLAISRIERSMKYLEGFAQVCCNCKRVKINDHWEDFSRWVSTHSEIKVSHGLCQDCLEKVYPNEASRVVELTKKMKL